MPTSNLTDLSRLAIHTQTNKPWTLEECLAGYAAAGVKGISVWRHVLEPMGAERGGEMIRAAGLESVALVRGGFFPAFEKSERQKALDVNRECIDEAAAIGAPMVVLVCGAVPGMPLAEARRQIAGGIEAVLPHAEKNDVVLAIEPLHPMYAGDKSAINRMAEAREICEKLGGRHVGIAVDVYHVWWDPDLEEEIRLAGQGGLISAFHICDWRVPTRDLLTDRGLMGEGCIDVKRIRGWVEDAGFSGWNEVEVFSEEHWAEDQAEYVEKIKKAYSAHG
jgi:sugar phosphate isomerase/epimerase